MCAKYINVYWNFVYFLSFKALISWTCLPMKRMTNWKGCYSWQSTSALKDLVSPKVNIDILQWRTNYSGIVMVIWHSAAVHCFMMFYCVQDGAGWPLYYYFHTILKNSCNIIQCFRSWNMLFSKTMKLQDTVRAWSFTQCLTCEW